MAQFVATITPSTVAAIVLSGIVLGWALWEEVTFRTSLLMVSVGVVFLLTFTIARLGSGAPDWQRPVGTTLLWILFVGVKFWVATFRRRRREP